MPFVYITVAVNEATTRETIINTDLITSMYTHGNSGHTAIEFGKGHVLMGVLQPPQSIIDAIYHEHRESDSASEQGQEFH